MKKTNYKKTIIIILAVFILAFAIRIGININNNKEEQRDDSIPVSIFTTQKSEFKKYIQIYGTAKAEKESIISPVTPAIVEKINVKPGQAVKKGDILFVMDTEDIDSRLKQAQGGYELAQNNYTNASGALADREMEQLKSSMESAKINYEDAKSNQERVKILYESGGASKKDLEQIENTALLLKNQYETSKKVYDLYVKEIKPSNTSIAQSQLKQAEAGYETAKKQYDDMIVRSDIDGEIGLSRVEIGQIAGGPQSISMTVVNYNTIILDMGVSEENISRINKNSLCKVKFDVIADKEFDGKIEGIGASVDPTNGLYQLKISIDNESLIIKPGMYARVKIYDETINGSITLPVDSVVNDGDNQYVFVLDNDNIAKKKQVITGDNNGQVIVIISGLDIGETKKKRHSEEMGAGR